MAKKRKTSSAPRGKGQRTYNLTTNDVLRLKNLIASTEVKAFRKLVYGSTVDSIGNSNPITNMAQGLTVDTRIGNQIRVNSIELRGKVEWGALTSTVAIVRIVIVQDLQQVSDTTPTWATAFDLSQDVYSFPNVENLKRFKVISDEVISREVDKNFVYYQKKFKVNSLVRFNGTGAADVQKNHFYMLAVSNVLTNLPALQVSARVLYTDE